MSQRLEGKIAIITGGASGIGLATVRRFLEEGARVVIADVQDEPGNQLVKELGENACYQHTDVSSENDVQTVVDKAVSQFGRLDCMFNNAGFSGITGDLEILNLEEQYRKTIDVLFTGVLSGIKHASRVMKSQESGGSIINTASVAGLRGGWGPHVYSAMKSAVISLSRSTSLELGPDSIRVNAICPGFIATAIFAGQANMNWDQRMQLIAELEQVQTVSTPIQRAGKAKDIADMALFLASDESHFVTGQAFVVDGGLTAGSSGIPDWSRFQDILSKIQT